MDELDVKEKDTLKYDKVEMREKDVPELAENEAKESGPAKTEETRKYVCYVCLYAQEFFAWLMLQGNL